MSGKKLRERTVSGRETRPTEIMQLRSVRWQKLMGKSFVGIHIPTNGGSPYFVSPSITRISFSSIGK